MASLARPEDPVASQGPFAAKDAFVIEDPVAEQGGWPQWRGRYRDGQAEWLPNSWSPPKKAWQNPLPSAGVGAVVGTEDFVIVSSRDIADQVDVFVCLDTETGVRLWEQAYPAPGKLDYGNSPRAAPLISDPYVYTLGAFGHLHCISLDTGKPVWSKHLVDDLGGIRPDWGYTASPLIVDGKLILQPGGDQNAIVALDSESGEVVWATPGRKGAYASPIVRQHSGMQQILNYDFLAMNAWDAATGKLLWEEIPPADSDFNVPTPVLFDDQLILTSENNATRLFEFDPQTSQPKLRFKFEELAGDTHSPVRLGRFLAGVHEDLFLLDVDHGLQLFTKFTDPLLTSYTTLIACHDRLLVCCENGTLILLQLSGGELVELGRISTQSERVQILAHPAVVGRKVLIRTIKGIEAWEFEESEQAE